MIIYFQFYFTSSVTRILPIPPVKYLSTSCPIRIFAVFCLILPIPYFNITHQLYIYMYISYRIILSTSLNIFPLFYLHPLSIHFYFLGLLSNITARLYRFYTLTIPFLRMSYLLPSQLFYKTIVFKMFNKRS